MAYSRNYVQLPSQILGRDLELLHFGDQGYPLILFPTSNGRFFDVEDQGLIGSLRSHIDQGYLQVFAVESLDWEALLASGVGLAERRDRWLAIEKHWAEELIPYARDVAQNDFVVVGGCSFGATHAVNFALRHPSLVRRCLALAGPYDLVNTSDLLEEFSREEKERELYFINPISYVANLSSDRWHELGGGDTDIKLLTADQDICLGDNLRLAELLGRNGIPHHLEVWQGQHDWDVWQAQIAAFA